MSCKSQHYAFARVLSRTFVASFFLIAIARPAAAQSKVSWGDEFKMHKGSTDLSISYADKSGIYVEESHMALKTYFVVGASMRKSATLVKLDPSSMAELYRNDFDKELKGKEFDRLFFIRDKLYLFATDYSKRDNSLNLYAAEIDKSSGNLKGDWQQIYAWQKQDKSEQIDYMIAPNSDSSRIVLTGTYTGAGQNRYEIKMMDDNLRSAGKPITITNEFDPKTFQVERFEYTASGNAVVIGRIYEYAEGKKKKDKNLEFVNYSIRLYNPQGKMISDVKTDIDGHYLLNSKVLLQKNELILAAFYSNDKKRRTADGLMVERLDPATGNVIVSTKQDLGTMKAAQMDGPPHPPVPGFLKKKDDDNDEVAIAGNIVFRDFYLTPDNGLVILAEKYSRIESSTNSYQANMGPGGGGTWNSRTTVDYKCGDIYMAKISAAGAIVWLHDLPKSQDEQIVVSEHESPAGGFGYYSYFEPADSRPFFAGYGSIAGKRYVHIFFNDNDDNAQVLNTQSKIKATNNFGKAACYEVVLDMVTGKYTRQQLYTNRDIPVSMPRLGIAMNDVLYLTGKQDRTFGKTKIVVGKIACTD